MPIKNINYSKTIIYKICCNDLNITDCYIGHTTDFKSRKNSHKYKCNKEGSKGYNSRLYQYIRDNGGWDNWSMILIEEYNCNNKLEALKRERELIEELKSTLNFEIPSRTNKEYREDNKDKILEKNKEYYEDNKDKIKERHKIYRENNKDKEKERHKIYSENNKEKIKKYYEDNKDKIKERHKEYYEDNKDKRKEKINCECGSCYRIDGKYQHFKTKKHQEYFLSTDVATHNYIKKS